MPHQEEWCELLNKLRWWLFFLPGHGLRCVPPTLSSLIIDYRWLLKSPQQAVWPKKTAPQRQAADYLCVDPVLDEMQYW